MKRLLFVFSLPIFLGAFNSDFCGKIGVEYCFKDVAINFAKNVQKGSQMIVSPYEKSQILACVSDVLKSCNSLNILELYMMQHSLDTCDDDGCPDDEEYNTVKCVDNLKDYVAACIVQAVIKGVESAHKIENFSEDAFTCRWIKSAMYCVLEIAREKCGQQAATLLKKELLKIYVSECSSNL